MQITSQNRPKFRLCILAAFALTVLLMVGCDGKAKKQTVKPPTPDVQVAEVTQAKVPIVMEFSGTIQAIKTVDIIPQVSGYIEERHFEEGTFVKKDDPLYFIDPRPYKAKLDALKAQLKLDQAGLAFWQKETKRYQTLVKQGAASKKKAEGTIAKRDELLATVEKDKANIENAQLDLSFTNITAPFDGRIQQNRINVGNLVQQQRDVLTTLVQLDPIYVVFNISRSHVFEIQLLKRQGKLFENADIRIEILLPDGSIYSQQGKVNFISFQINPTTDTILLVRCRVKNNLFGLTSVFYRFSAVGGIAFLSNHYFPSPTSGRSLSSLKKTRNRASPFPYAVFLRRRDSNNSEFCSSLTLDIKSRFPW